MITCAAYYDAAMITAQALEAYWVSSREKIVIADSPDIVLPGWRTIELASTSGWGDRLKMGLQEIEASTVILLFDDFTPEAYIDDAQVSVIEQLTMEHQADVVYLHYPFFDERVPTESTAHLQRVRKNAFAINSAPAIWKTRTLIDTLHPDDTPWTWETFAMYRCHGRRAKKYTVSKGAAIYPYALAKGGLIQQGLYNPEGLKRHIQVFGDMHVNPNRLIKTSNSPRKRSFRASIEFMTAGVRLSGPAALLFLKYYAIEKVYRVIERLRSRTR